MDETGDVVAADQLLQVETEVVRHDALGRKSLSEKSLKGVERPPSA
ncbi:MAG: hypothetical protein ACOYB4_09075 [Methyloceanibacter sp.]